MDFAFGNCLCTASNSFWVLAPFSLKSFTVWPIHLLIQPKNWWLKFASWDLEWSHQSGKESKGKHKEESNFSEKNLYCILMIWFKRPETEHTYSKRSRKSLRYVENVVPLGLRISCDHSCDPFSLRHVLLPTWPGVAFLQSLPLWFFK